MCSHFFTYSQCQIPFCYTGRLLPAERGIAVPRNSLACCNAWHLRIRRLVQFIFAETVRNNALTNRAALLCRTQRRVARMCSSNLSVNCEKVEKDTLR